MLVDLGHARDHESFTFEDTFVAVGPEDEEFDCRVAATLALTKSGSRYLLEGTVSSRVRAECHRCLGPCEHELETGLSIVLQRGGGEIPEGTIEEDFILLAEGQEYRYDVFPRVREAVVLELPIRFLCREDCAGICAGCGANLNTETCTCAGAGRDPRWGALKKLLKDDDAQ